MLKMMMPPLFMVMMLLYNFNFINLYLIIMTILLMYMLFYTNMLFSYFYSFIMMDKLSLIMMMLSTISVILIVISSNSLNSISKTIMPILMILMITFVSKNMFMFYIMFEMVLIPTMILISMNGKQPERLQASIYLIIYTITASLPLLMSIIFFKMNMSFFHSELTMFKYNMIMFVMMAFLVKMPMYLSHLWLPKAHVEAPLEGSMILAAILLKLGGYGIIRFIPMCIASINKMNYWIISISLIGATTTSMNCIRQKDLKSLIAYSSVVHMGFILTSLFTLNNSGLMGAIIMMIAHGLSSSALFLLVNDLYFKYHTRNILLFKGLLTVMPNLTFWWFMFMALNISAPPTINTISEILMMNSLIMWNYNSIFMVFIMSLMSASFSLMMFINIIHNKNEMLFSINSYQKTFLSLIIHILPTIMLILKMETLMILLYSLKKTMVCGTNNFLINFMFILMMMISLILIMISLILSQMNFFYIIKILLLKMTLFSISIDIMTDWMSLMFLGMVMLISSLIIFFSKYYIPNKEHKQFLILLLMFVLSMSILIISNNLFLILLGWDGLGLSSYILVVYYQNSSSASSGTITLLSNRIGDILILLSLAMMTLSSNWNFNMNFEFTLLPLILIMIAACSKSAQFPFSAWLPMAMAAPTPISALVHSSTLVTAGVFILLRIMNINHPNTLIILLMISSMTTIYASMSANWEQDLKKIIALSTLSQIAMMMFAISMNSMILAFMHLIIHALFKSAMFLCAGIMIHESSYQDMRMMGINLSNSPLTLSILGINSMALMGIPFMSGFFSKDAIIENMMSSYMNMFMSMLMMMSIGMTAAYSLRMSFMSNKNIIKSTMISSNHQKTETFIPIILLSMMAITSGSWMTWISTPNQMFMLTTINKITIIIILVLGMLVGFSLQFKNSMYMKLGSSSISLWFSHFISIFPSNLLFPMMQNYINIDAQWQEKYGPQKMNKSLYMMTILPEKSKMSMMMIITMMMMFPLFIS